MTMPSTTMPANKFRFVACVGLAAILATGCEQAPKSTAPAAPIVERTPESRLNNIVEALKRHLEGKTLASAGAVIDYDAPAGTPVTDATTTVSAELIEPAGEGDNHKATLTLETKSTVTMVLPQKTDAEKEAEKAANSLGEEIEGIPPLESLVAPPAATSSISGGSAIQTLPDEQVSTYELEYRGDRWELVTEIDRTVEPFNALAVDYALKRQ